MISNRILSLTIAIGLGLYTVQPVLSQPAIAPLATTPKVALKTTNPVLTEKLITAIAKQDYKTFRVLVRQNVDIHARTRSGITPLLFAAKWAAEWDDNATIQWLLERGANVNDSDGSPFGCDTPLMIAIQQVNIEAVRLLLSYGADVNAIEAHGWSVLSFAQTDTNYYIGWTWSTREFAQQQREKRQQIIAPMLKAAGAKEFEPHLGKATPDGYKRVGASVEF